MPRTAAPRNPGRLRAKFVRILLLSLTLVGVLMLLAIASLQVKSSRVAQQTLEQQIRSSLEEKGRTRARDQAYAFAFLTETNALSDMQALVERTVASDPDVVYGVFVNSERQVLAYASTENPKWDAEAMSGATQRYGPLPIARNVEIRELQTAAGSLLEVSHAVRTTTEQRGVIRYGLSMKRMEDTLVMTREQAQTLLRQTLVSIVLVVLLVTLLGLALSLREARRITQPVLALAEAATRFARDKGAITVKIDSNDELQTLGETFNYMTAELQRSIETLRSNRDELAREVEERKRAETQRAELQTHLLESQKLEAVGQLAGGVAHDFNNLLMVITGSRELLEETLLERLDPEEQSLLEAIGEACKQAAFVTKQLLGFSRRGVCQPASISVNKALSGLSMIVKRLLPETITCRVHFETDVPAVFINQGSLEQVVLNLAVNARDAMPTGGLLTVSAACVELTEARQLTSAQVQPGRYAKITVSDTGKGIEEEALHRIFEPFFTTKEVGKGTGLGLAMVHGIVKQAEGAVDVHSILREGTRFEVWLPESMREEQQVNNATQEQRDFQPIGQPILICEDDAGVNRFLTRTLKQQGLEVTSFSDPVELLNHCLSGNVTFGNGHAGSNDADDNAPSLLISDVVMPSMNGPTLLEKLRQRWPDLPVLFVSGYTQGVPGNNGLMGKPGNTLMKPFGKQELLTRVHSAVQSPDERQSQAYKA